MYYSPANTWKVAARLHPRTKYGLTATSQASVYPDPPPHPPLEPHYTIPLSHLHDPLYQAMPDPPLWWCPDGGTGSGGGGTPSGPVNSVQFNNNGAFGGNANLTYDPVTGFFSVNNPFIGDLTSISGIPSSQTINTTIQNTGTATGGYYFAQNLTTSVPTNSTGPIDSVYGSYLSVSNNGAGTLRNLYGAYIYVNQSGTQPLNKVTGLRIDGVTSTTTATAIGLLVSDFSTVGTTNFNIQSMGVSSINQFQGILRLGPSVNSNPQDGDLWYDGTHLNFRHGSTTTVLV